MRWLATLSLASLCCAAYAATALAAEDEEEESKTKCPSHKQTFCDARAMSASKPKTDIRKRE